MTFLNRLLNRQHIPSYIVIVSGLPRSGTSMMMKMLDVVGIPPLTDNVRTADDDNPKGYYEFERVKKLREGDNSWLHQARGKSVKVISALLPHLPPDYEYRVVFMRRLMDEILASQRKMQINRGEDPDKVSDEELALLYEKHLHETYNWLNSQKNLRWVDISYNALLEDPVPQLAQISRLLDGKADVRRMASIVDERLYRQRVDEG